MVFAPEMAAKPAGQGHKRVAQLVSRLLAHNIDSRASLAAAWRNDKGLLKPELAAWMKAGSVEALVENWPQLLAESRKSSRKLLKLRHEIE